MLGGKTAIITGAAGTWRRRWRPRRLQYLKTTLIRLYNDSISAK